ncbi:hypothetical protein FXN59_08470 [Aggregatibacter actinomycetemcomitans]|uniref:hypothetical protein n=1 Tax=Aggregatibacter actinomycetemcomitans TaxID=714 RepID=UPI0011E07A56|nr:hypothetical protein [Aggregatibacter actinomycetemcomitans]QEH47597.1 hypothetical protein FXN59_08415 [Aggregatibacter actinomycetemcomitans]QEH47601.1 hypothetical protein FXN59_08470 [Aggregatibacter actinomycetemcomitans]
MKKIILTLSTIIFTAGFRYDGVREYGAFKYEESPFTQQRTEQFEEHVSKKIVEDFKKPGPKAKIERIGKQEKIDIRKLKGRN